MEEKIKKTYEVNGEIIRVLKNKRKLGVGSIIAIVLLAVYGLSLVMSLMWGVLNSFKGRIDFLENPFGFPQKWMFSNYIKAFNELNIPIESGKGSRDIYMPELFWNTILYSVGRTAFATLTPCITAYVVAKYRFKFRSFIYSIVIITMLLPIVGGLSSEMLLVRAIGFYDNMIGLWIMSGSFLGMYFLIFYAAFKGFSWEYAEAAFIDGASHLKVLLRVMLPLARPILLAVGLLVFIGNWNDYMTQLIYLPSYPSISYGLWSLQFSNTSAATAIPVQLAGCVIVSVPIVIVYIIFKEQLVGNLAVGGIKG